MLSSKTAICWIPPRKHWPPLQRLRVFQDEEFIRWPPHIKLFHPFPDDSPSSLRRAAEGMQEVRCLVPWARAEGGLSQAFRSL